MQKLIIKVNCLLSPDKLEELRRNIERQFYSGGAIALDDRFSYELVEADSVEVISGADKK